MKFFFCFLFSVFICLPSQAQESPGFDTIEAQIQTLKNSDQPAEAREAQISLLEELRNSLTQHGQSQKNKAQYQLEIENAPAVLEAINLKLAEPRAEGKNIDTSALETREVEQKVDELLAQQATAQSKVAALASNLKQREQRLIEIPKQLATAQNELAEFILPPKPLNSAEPADQINYQVQVAKQQNLRSQIDELALEQQFSNTTAELANAQHELAKKELAALEIELKKWQDALEKKQTEASKAAKIETKNQAKRFQHIPELAQLALENAELAQLNTRILNLTAETKAQQQIIAAQREETTNQRQNAQKRLELLESAKIRIDTATGALLRQQRSQLPTSRSLQESLKKNIHELTEAQIALLEINKRQQELPENPSKTAAEIAEKLKLKDISEPDIVALLNQRRDFLLKVGSDYQRYIAALEEYSQANKLTLEEVEKYSFYLDERLLWIPSASQISFSDFKTETTTALVYFQKNTLPWLQSLLRDLIQHPLLWLTYLIVLSSLFLLRARSFARLSEIQHTVNSRHCASIVPTLRALRHTLILSAFFPILLVFLAWRSQGYEALSQGLFAAAMFLLSMSFLRYLSSPTGILTGHFGMDSQKVAHFYYHLTWFSPLMSVFMFLTFALPKMHGSAEVGRLIFIVSMIFLGIFAHLIFRPSKKMIEPKGHFAWYPKFIHLVTTGIPLAYIIGVSSGYIATVFTLREKLSTTIWFGLLVAFVMHLLFRWILVSRRRLAREQAVKKYEAIIAKRNATPSTQRTKTPTFEELEASAINPVKIEAQTTRLVQVIVAVVVAIGLWGIWSPILPALSFLDEVTIWGGAPNEENQSATQAENIRDTLIGKTSAPSENSENSEAQSQGNETTPENADAPKPGISLQDLLVTFFIIALTITAASNLPGLFELSLLRKIDLKPGSNYAITTILRYLIIVIGLVIAFGHIGVTWSSVQWLAAAVTLGIGFGLQEIFANFVAGLILLFERPIRLGDLVTVGEVSGTVAQIQIRATTIRQFNNRELIVPNKEFITGQIVNWTLHDSILRFEMPVGIAYGSDADVATSIMRDLLSQHEKILDDPAPEVLFSTFGASTLDFTIRAYVGSPSFLVSTQSELHYQINRAFRDAGIQITIPQHDLFIKSIPEIVIKNPTVPIPNKPSPNDF